MIEISWSHQTNRDKWRQICTRRRTMSNFLTTKCNKTHKKYQAREAFSLMLICWKWKIFIWFSVMSFSLYLHNALWKPVFLWPAITHVLVVHSLTLSAWCPFIIYCIAHNIRHPPLFVCSSEMNKESCSLMFRMLLFVLKELCERWMDPQRKGAWKEHFCALYEHWTCGGSGKGWKCSALREKTTALE